ncbi:MAG: hypothetical protein QM786_05470 [Breznakibacter sp.]
MEFIFQLIADLFLGEKDEALRGNEGATDDKANYDAVAEAPLAVEETPGEANIFTMMEFH